MPIVNMTQAAKLAGINRTTLYRKVAEGKLSAIKDQEGKSTIDTAEIIRCFPHRAPYLAQIDFSSETAIDYPDNEQQATFKSQQDERSEHHQATQLKREIEHLQQLLVAKDQVIEAQAQALRLVEYKVAQEQPKENTTQELEEKNRIIEAQARLLDHENIKKKGLFAWLF